MKTKIFVLLFSIIVSISLLCSINSRPKDYTANDLGGYVVYQGVKSGKGLVEFIGSVVAGGGGAAVAEGIGIYAGVVVGSNPAGWIIGGAAAVL